MVQEPWRRDVTSPFPPSGNEGYIRNRDVPYQSVTLDVTSEDRRIGIPTQRPRKAIGSFIAHRKPDFEFLNAGALFTNTASVPFVWAARPRKCRRKRGKGAGLPIRLPLGKSDHSSVMLLPAYRQKLKLQFNAGRTNRTLYYRTVLIMWTGTCSGQRLMTT